MPKADQVYAIAASTSRSRRAKPTAHYAEAAAKIADANASAAAMMREVRAAARYLRDDQGYSLTVFATVTGLHKNSVMRLFDPTWMPKPETLRRLDKLIVRADAKRRGESFPAEAIKRGRPSKG